MLETKTKLSTLWIIIMLNMIFADIYTVFVQLSSGGLMEFPGDVETIMFVAVFLTNIPIMMIYLSRSLNFTANRPLNIVASILTIIYVIGGGSFAPHYIATAVIEVTLLLFIIKTACAWKDPIAISSPNDGYV